MSEEQIVEQFQQIFDTLKRIVDASGELAARVDKLEQNWGDAVGALTAIQGSVQVLLESHRAEGARQNQFHEHIIRSLAQLEVRVSAMDGGSGLPVM